MPASASFSRARLSPTAAGARARSRRPACGRRRGRPARRARCRDRPAPRRWPARRASASMPTAAAAGLSGGESPPGGAGAGAGRPSRTCCCSTSRPTTSTSPASSGSRPSWTGFSGGLVLVSHDRAFLARLAEDLVAGSRAAARAATTASPAFEAWSEAILEAEEAELARLDKRIAAEMHWLHRGVTARRKRNKGRLRRLRARCASARASGRPPHGIGQARGERGPGRGRLVIEAEARSRASAGGPSSMASRRASCAAIGSGSSARTVPARRRCCGC